MRVRVYYRKDPEFELDGELTRNKVIDEETHAFVREIDVDDPLTEVFREMQGEIWSPNGEARELIQRLGLRHTSMSVGDVMYVMDTDLMFQCAPFGWEPVLGQYHKGLCVAPRPRIPRGTGA